MSNLNQDLSQLLRVDFDDEEDDVENGKPEQKACLEYIQLIGIQAAKAKKEIRKALIVGPGKGKRLSLSEQTLEKAASLHGTDLVR